MTAHLRDLNSPPSMPVRNFTVCRIRPDGRLKRGLSSTDGYGIFIGARRRCRNRKAKDYKWYGKRGIKFLYESIEQFFADVGPRPPGAWLDRLDNDGPYAPGNCLWTSRAEQQNNKRSNVRITAFGITRTASRWAREPKQKNLGLSSVLIITRIRHGWSAEDALTKPVIRNRKKQLDLFAGRK